MAEFSFDFEKATKDGASKKEIIDFLKQNNTNIKWQDIENSLKKQEKNKDFKEEDFIFETIKNNQNFKLLIDNEKPLKLNETKIKQNENEININTKDYKQGENFINVSNEKLSIAKNKNNDLDKSYNEMLENINNNSYIPKVKKSEKNILKNTYNELVSGFDFLQTSDYKKEQSLLKASAQKSALNNVAYEDLEEATKDYLTKKYINERSFFNFDDRENNEEVGKLQYEKIKILQNAKNKDFKDLSDNEKELIAQERGPLNSLANSLFFEGDKTNFEEFKAFDDSQEITKNLQKIKIRLDENHYYKSPSAAIKSLISGEIDTKAYDNYLNDLNDLALEVGFDNIGTDKDGNIYAFKGENVFKINEGFFDNAFNILEANKFSLSGSLLGAVKGASKGKGGAVGKVAGAVVGSAVGAFAGGMADTIYNNLLIGRENTFKEVLDNGIEEGILSLVGDGVALTGIKAFKPLTKVAQKASEYSPFLGFARRSLNGNKEAVQKLLNKSLNMSEEQAQTLKEFSESFGGELNTQSKEGKFKKIEAKFGEDSFITKGAKNAYEIFTLNNQKEFQKDLIRRVRADEDGSLIAFLAEAANISPIANQNLKTILNETTSKLSQNLENLNLAKTDIKKIFDTLESGTKQSYNKAVDETLEKLYHKGYKVRIDKETGEIFNAGENASEEVLKKSNFSYENFRKELDEMGVLPEDSMRFLNFVEKNVYNEDGVTFSQLNNARKQLNSMIKDNADKNFQNFVKSKVINFIKEDINDATNELLKQNKSLYKDALTLFETALNDYKNMKDITKIVDDLGLRNTKKSYDNVMKSFEKFLQGQGEVDVNNYQRLTKNLNNSQKTDLELNLLNHFFKQSLYEKNDLKVFDSAEFFKKLKNLGENTFTSNYAKDFIKMAQGFDTLFKNDALIAKALRQSATTEKIGSSIATTISGAAKMQVTKGLFAFLVRNAPYVPLMPKLNEKIQGAAIRYHLNKALEKSSSISEFKNIISKKIETNKEFTNETKKVLSNFLQKLDKSQDDILESIEKQGVKKKIKN
ncbi:hypothetical protein FMM56_06140 [Campylobacter sp. LR264d]|uniref:hypothetical protein n=1 Tax=Campylobacter sp. LR264d TaxID=2593544 RepID=UPI00123BFF9A|nr:hypothetical protein [Campylobacter sp. LR264d]KAA6230396.1 hypothetical protein FMM56_06140 [Campylobacter sp. LR264d]